jgi:hypothetical protein
MKLDSKEFLKKSIKVKIITVLLSIILVMLFISLFFIFFQFKIIGSYTEVIDNMLLVREISKTLPVLIEDYNGLSKNIGNPERIRAYNLDRDKIESIFLKLDKTIVNEESRIIYKGLKNIVKDVLADCDKGIEDIRDGKITTYSFYYSEANRKSYYVEETTSHLLAKEIEFTEITHGKIQRTHKTSVILGLSLLIFITLSCIVFSIMFSNEIIMPLNNLLAVVEKIKSGSQNARSENNHDDEIGKLGVAFNEMIEKIVDSQAELKLERNNLEKSKKELEMKVDELEKFQKITINRELKMIELKKKMRDLEKGKKEEKK